MALVEPLLALVKAEARRVKEVLVSNTMRLSPTAEGEAVGVWEPTTGRVVVKRDQLKRRELFLATVLHEIGHAHTGAPDMDVEFEQGLTLLLGKTASSALPSSRPVGMRDKPERRGLSTAK